MKNDKQRCLALLQFEISANCADSHSGGSNIRDKTCRPVYTWENQVTSETRANYLNNDDEMR